MSRRIKIFKELSLNNWKLISLFLIVGSGLIFSFFARAETSPSLGFSVAPQIFEVDVFPGETLNRKINLGNLSNVALPIFARLTDFTAEGDSGEMLFDESNQDPSFASRFWIKFETPNFILAPQERRELKFSINVPSNAEPGGHYSVALFEPQLPSFYFKEGQPRAIPVVGVLFLISVKTLSLEPEVEKKLEVVEFSLPKEERILVLENILSKMAAGVARAAEFTISEKPPSKFILRIKNNDIYHIKPYGKISIYNIFGKKVGETEVLQKTILPGKTRIFPVEFSSEIPEKLKWLPSSISNFLIKNFFIGKYQAKLELEAKTPSSAEIFKPAGPVVLKFFSLPWQFWLPFILIFGLLISLIIKYRKRITLALKTLIRSQ